jgi:hypothetical protein
MTSRHEAFNALVYQTLEAAAALLEAGRPAEALHTIKNLAEMEITARQREQYIALRREIDAQLVTDSWVALQLAHPEPLTFHMLADAVMPYLEALHNLHEMVAWLQGRPPASDPEIRQMSHHSPLSITLGFWHPDIIQTILEVIFDERRGPSRRLKQGKQPVSALLTRVDAAYRLLERVVPDASEAQKAALANRILADIDMMASSLVEAQVIGVSVRPEPSEPGRWRVPEPAPAEPSAPEPPKSAAEPESKPEPEPELEPDPGPDPGPEDPDVAPESPMSPPPSGRPRYIGGQQLPDPSRYQRRVTRPVPKPRSFSPDDENGENDEDYE